MGAGGLSLQDNFHREHDVGLKSIWRLGANLSSPYKSYAKDHIILDRLGFIFLQQQQQRHQLPIVHNRYGFQAATAR